MSTASPFTRRSRADGKSWPWADLLTVYRLRCKGKTWPECGRVVGCKGENARQAMRGNCTPEAWAAIVRAPDRLRIADRRRQLPNRLRGRDAVELERVALFFGVGVDTVKRDLKALGLWEGLAPRLALAKVRSGRKLGQAALRWHPHKLAACRAGWPPVPPAQRRFLEALEGGPLRLREWLAAAGVRVPANRPPRINNTTAGRLAEAGYVVADAKRVGMTGGPKLWRLAPDVAAARQTAARRLSA